MFELNFKDLNDLKTSKTYGQRICSKPRKEVHKILNTVHAKKAVHESHSILDFVHKSRLNQKLSSRSRKPFHHESRIK